MSNKVTPVCFGVGCGKRGECARYRALEGSDPFTVRIGMCQGGLFEPHKKVLPIAVDRRREVAAEAA